MFRRRCRVGFTLVELLVVIGIIGVLVGILFPAFTLVRLAAKQIVCESNLKQFGLAIGGYAAENHGELPQKGPDGSNQTTNSFSPKGGVRGFDDTTVWFNALPPYINHQSYYEMLIDDSLGGEQAPHPGATSNIFICPIASPPGTQNGNDLIFNDWFILYGTDSTGTLKNSTGMAAQGQFKFNFSYVWNSKLTSAIGQDTQLGINLGRCSPSSDIVLMVEKINNASEYMDKEVQTWVMANPSVYYNNGKINQQGSNTNVAQSKSDWTRFAARHNHGGNLLFADGHVDFFHWNEVQYTPDQLPYNPNTSNANQSGKVVWSAIGPVNSN